MKQNETKERVLWVTEVNAEKESEKMPMLHFSTWTLFWHQGFPMKIRSEFQPHFLFPLNRFGNNFDTLPLAIYDCMALWM